MKPIAEYLSTKNLNTKPKNGDISEYCIILPFGETYYAVEDEFPNSGIYPDLGLLDVFVVTKEDARNFIKNKYVADDGLIHIYEIPSDYDNLEDFIKDYENSKFKECTTRKGRLYKFDEIDIDEI